METARDRQRAKAAAMQQAAGAQQNAARERQREKAAQLTQKKTQQKTSMAQAGARLENAGINAARERDSLASGQSGAEFARPKNVAQDTSRKTNMAQARLENAGINAARERDSLARSRAQEAKKKAAQRAEREESSAQLRQDATRVGTQAQRDFQTAREAQAGTYADVLEKLLAQQDRNNETLKQLATEDWAQRRGGVLPGNPERTDAIRDAAEAADWNAEVIRKKQGGDATPAVQRSAAQRAGNLAAIQEAMNAQEPGRGDQYFAERPSTEGTKAADVLPYLLGMTVAGTAGALGDIRQGADLTIGDVMTGGKRGREYQTLNEYFQQNPEMAKQAEQTGGSRQAERFALETISQATGVPKDRIRMYLQSTEAERWLQDVEDTHTISPALRESAGQWMYSIGQQLPGIALTAGAGTGAAAAKLARAVTLGIMGAQSYGGKLADNAKQYGFTPGGYVNALVTAAVETGTELIDDFVPAAGELLTLATPTELTKNMLGEGMEEAIGYPLEQIADYLLLPRGEKTLKDLFDLKEWIGSFASGAIVGGLMGSAGALVTLTGRVMDGEVSLREAARTANEIAATLPGQYRPAPLDETFGVSEAALQEYMGKVVAGMEQYADDTRTEAKKHPERMAEGATESQETATEAQEAVTEAAARQKAERSAEHETRETERETRETERETRETAQQTQQEQQEAQSEDKGTGDEVTQEEVKTAQNETSSATETRRQAQQEARERQRAKAAEIQRAKEQKKAAPEKTERLTPEQQYARAREAEIGTEEQQETRRQAELDRLGEALRTGEITEGEYDALVDELLEENGEELGAGLEAPEAEDRRQPQIADNPGAWPTGERTEERTQTGVVRDAYTRTALSEETFEELDEAAKALGVRVEFVDEIAGGRANGAITGNLIRIEKGNRNPLRMIFGHELTHRVQDLAPEAYRAFREFAAQEVGDDVQRKLELYRANGQTLNYEQALDEAAADYAGRLMESTDVLDRFIARNRDNRTLLERMRDAFHDLKAKLTGQARRQAQTAEGRLSAALDAAAEQARTLEENKKTAPEGGERYSIERDGRYLYVQADRQVIHGNNPELWEKQVENYINSQIRNGQDIMFPTTDGHVLALTERSAYKLSDRHRAKIAKEAREFLTDEEFARKAHAAGHIDELIQVAKFARYREDQNGAHQNDIGEDGFNTYRAYFKDADGSYYRIHFTAGLNGQEETTYSIGHIERRSLPAKSDGSSGISAGAHGAVETSSTPSIYTSAGKSQPQSEIYFAYQRALEKKRNAGKPQSTGEQNTRYSFAGERAKTADLEGLKRAKELAEHDVAAETILEQTGWYQGMDGKWRYEIDDSGMEYRRDADANLMQEEGYRRLQELTAREERGELTAREREEMNRLEAEYEERVFEEKFELSDFLKHDALFEAYPQLRHTALRFDALEPGANGFYDRRNGTIVLSQDLIGAPEATLLHEIQHVIQKAEGFTGGASPEYWARTDYENGTSATERLQERYDSILNAQSREDQNKFIRYQELERAMEPLFLADENTEDGQRYLRYEAQQDALYEELYPNAWFRDLLDLDRRMGNPQEEYMNMYRSTAGEIEARDAASRRNMTAQERRSSMPNLGDADTVFADERAWRSSSEQDGETSSIKEQIEGSKDKLNAMAVVARAAVPINLTSKSEAARWAENLLKSSGYKVDRQGYGEISFSKKDIDKGLRYSDTPEEKAALAVLPQVLKRGIEIGGHTNHKGREKQTITFAAPVELNGTRGNMAVVVNKHGNRYYAHRIVLPDGTTFRFSSENKNDAARELSQGVAVSDSLAETTSAASDSNVPENSKNVKQRFSIKEDAQPQIADNPGAWPTGESAQTEQQTEQQKEPTPFEQLSNRAKEYTSRAEREFIQAAAKTLSLPRNEKQKIVRGEQLERLQRATRSMTNAYLKQGRLSQKQIDGVFDRLYVQEHIDGVPDQDVRKWAKYEWNAAAGTAMERLSRVKRYAEQTKAEKIAYTAETIRSAYDQIKTARREMEKAKHLALLTKQELAQATAIAKGTFDVKDLHGKNAGAVAKVADAMREYEDLARAIRQYNEQRKQALRDEADQYLQGARTWKDKKTGLAYSTETLERNIRDIVPDKATAEKMVQRYVTTYKNNEAARNRDMTRLRNQVREMNLSREIKQGDVVSEAHAVQLYGEAEDAIRMLERSNGRLETREGKNIRQWEKIIQNLWANSPGLDQNKIRSAAQEFRSIYDELMQRMNDARVENGYEPVAYRSGYFPHFQPGEGDGILRQFAKNLGMSIDVTSLPTSINGMTKVFKPGIRWISAAQERNGFSTVYDAVEGFDKYLEGVSDVIYHTGDIQAQRALAAQIRYRTTDAAIQEQIDAIRYNPVLTEDEREMELARLYADKERRFELSHFVVDLEEHINTIANKRSSEDRAMEEKLGRNIYNLMKNVESRVAANMVAVNPGSWLTNFIPLSQAWATTSGKNILQGMWDTLKNIKQNDGFAESSTFLTNRRGSEQLVKSYEQTTEASPARQKIRKMSGQWSETLGKPMDVIDSFTSEAIMRARYRQNLERGMSEALAMEEADNWAADIMADRSKGATPNIFNARNPLTKAFTQFQLEVNNELRWIAKDLPRMAGGNKKQLAQMIAKFLLGAWLYNQVYEFIVGRKAALDPIGIVNDTVGDLTGYQLPNLFELGIDAVQGEASLKTRKETLPDAIGNLGENVADELPFIGGLLGGGRIPISSALPDAGNLLNAATNKNWSARKRFATAGKEIGGSVGAYLLLPFGGGAVKKLWQTTQGMIQGGVYGMDADGNAQIKYPLYTDSAWDAAATLMRGTLFGTSTTKTGREWAENGFGYQSARKTAVYKDMRREVGDREAWKTLQGMQGAGRGATQREALRSMDADGKAKAIYYYGMMTKDAGRERMDALTDAGEDAWEAAQYLMAKSDADGSKEKRKVLLDSGLSGKGKLLAYASDLDEESQELQYILGLDKDAPAEKIVQTLCAIKDAANAEDKSQAKRDAVRNSGLSDEDALDLYTSIVSSNEDRNESMRVMLRQGMSIGQIMDAADKYAELSKESGSASQKATAFSAWVDRQKIAAKAKDTVKDAYGFYSQMRQDAERYESFRSAGLTADESEKLDTALRNLKPESGKTTVSELQKLKAVTKQGISESKQNAAFRELMTEDSYAKFQQAQSYGVTPKLWVKWKEEQQAADADGNGSLNQTEAESAIRKMFGLMPTPEELAMQAALWQLTNKSWKSKNNPFDKTIGQEVYEKLNAE